MGDKIGISLIPLFYQIMIFLRFTNHNNKIPILEKIAPTINKNSGAYQARKQLTSRSYSSK